MMEVGVGVVLMLLGKQLRVLAGLELRRAGLTLHDAQHLVRPPRIASEGPYRYFKHPAYIGSLLFIAGAGVACLGWGGAVIALASWPLYQVRMLEEERILKEMRDG